MYMGHFGIGLGVRRLSSSSPVWLLLVASISPDIADALSGFTPWGAWVNEYSHTILGIVSLAVLIGLLGWLITRSSFAALLAAMLVISHLLVDYLTSHIPAWHGGPAVGLGLYRYPIADFILESAVILLGIYFYRQSLKGAQRRPGIFAVMLLCLLGFQLVIDTMVFG